MIEPMRFMSLAFVALACVVGVAGACSDDDDVTAAVTTPDASSDAQVSTSDAGDAGDGDAGDAGGQGPLGSACGTDNTKCASRFCVDGVCCDQACTGQCMGCNNANSAGKCTNIPRLEEDPSYVNDAGTVVDCTKAVGGAKCDGAGKCLRAINTPCEQGPDCLSGKCEGADTMKCRGAAGELCEALSDCASNDCALGVCK